MHLEQLPEDMSELSREHVDELLETVLAFINARGLRIGVCMLLLDCEGIKTVGNVPPELQLDVMQEICNRLTTTGADTIEEIKGAPRH